MKTFLILIFMICLEEVKGQHLTSSCGLERTVSATESQFTVGYETKRQWAIGTFYQAAIAMKPFRIENSSGDNSWYGLYLNAPLVRSQKISFYAQLRTGLVDRKFIVCVPSLETRMQLMKGLSATVGASFRHTYPAFLLKLHIGLFNNEVHKRSQTAFK